MIVERPYEIDHVPRRLHVDSYERVSAALAGRTAQEQEDTVLARALAAFAVHEATEQEVFTIPRNVR